MKSQIIFSNNSYCRLKMASTLLKNNLNFGNSARYLNTTAYNLNKNLLKRYNSSVIKTLPSNKFIRNYSDKQVTLENIFGNENKGRVIEELKSVRAVKDLPWTKKGKLPRAGVLVPLCTVKGVPSLLFTKRTAHLNSYSGHVSFPGGKMDPTDKDITETALRETEEEIGLSPGGVDVWGEMTAVPSKDFASAVTPVVAFCGEIDEHDFDHSEHEVAHVFTRSVESLCKPENHGYTRFQSKRSGGYTLPVFYKGEFRIWGLTAIILHQTLTLIAPGLYKSSFDIKELKGRVTKG